MKTKAIYTIIAALMLLFSATVITQCKQAANKDGIDSFLALFGLQVQSGATNDLLKNFDMPTKRGAIVQLVNILCNKSGVSKNSKPIFKLTVNVTDSDLKDAGTDITQATFSVKLSRDTLNISDKTTTLSLKIKKVANSTFKIVDVDADQLLKDYIGFENLVRSTILTDADIYTPQTLAAFKTAEALKAKYDSIPWFQHMGANTYYFVAKGKMNLEEALGLYNRDTVPTYKLGLVDGGQKEIIPVGYDLIHNIGATFPNLIEVEKNKKRGFYNLTGQAILAAEYDQIFPLNEADNLAVLRKGNDYYWWKNDYTVSDKDETIKIAEILPRIQAYGKSVKLTETVLKNVTEYNSRGNHGSVYFAPSYMVDWALLPVIHGFKNPLRRNVEYEDVSELYGLQFDGKTENDSWLASVFYSIKDNYLGGREGLYAHKNVLVINKNNNRIYAHDISSYLSEMDGDSGLEGKCNISELRAINDTLYEIVVGANTYRELYNKRIVSGGSEYHYLALKNDKLEEMPADRLFSFTKYVKMDDRYLKGCYMFTDGNGTQTVDAEMMRYMKNEIYAAYKYQFKDKRWAQVFGLTDEKEKYNANVEDSLSAIERYNIAFIEQKLKGLNGKKAPLEINKNKALAAQ